MKNLIIIRHAKSDWSHQNQSDFDRVLNSRGMNDAPKMAKLIYNKNIEIDLFLSSSAVRTNLTCNFFAKEFNYPFDKIEFNHNLYEASLKMILNEINQIDNNKNTVAVFGHNPGLSYLIEYLTNEKLGNLPTCSVVSISFDIDSWQELSSGIGTLLFFEYPKKYFYPNQDVD